MECIICKGNRGFRGIGPKFDDFKSGGLNEKHGLAARNSELSWHLLESKRKPRESVSRWLVTGLTGYILTAIWQTKYCYLKYDVHLNSIRKDYVQKGFNFVGRFTETGTLLAARRI
jgi:hypothetical protein